MARLGDVPKLLHSVGVVEFARRVWRQIIDDDLFAWASALAYSWLFAFFPFLLFLLALIPYLPEKTRKDVRDDVLEVVEKQLPAEASKAIRDNITGNVDNILHEPRGWLLYSGLVVALWVASNGMNATMRALDKCYEIDRGRPFHRQRLWAISLTVVVGLMLLTVACLLPLGSAIRDWVVYLGVLSKRDPLLIVFDLARWFLSMIFLLGVLALIYYKGPSVKHHFYWLTPGAAFCMCVWVVLGLLFRLYMDKIGSRSYDRTYGTLGGVAILLLLFYLDALVLLIGAEINSEIDFEVLKVPRGTRDFRRAENVDAGKAAAV